MHPRRLVGVALVLALAVLVLRRSEDVLAPTLFSEDLWVFFVDQNRDGFTPLAEYHGALYIVQRIVALAASPLPIQWTPFVYNVSALLIAVAAAGVVLLDRAQTIIPGFAARLLAFFLLVLNPVSSEVSGTLTNIAWPLAISLCILLLLPAPTSQLTRALELAVVGLVGLTGSTALIALPCAIAGPLLWRSRYVYLRASLAMVTLVAQTIAFASSTRETGSVWEVLSQPTLTVKIIAWRWGAARVFGEEPSTAAMDRWYVFLLTLSIGLFILLCATWVSTKSLGLAHRALLASGFIGVFSGLVASTGYLDSLEKLAPPPWGERYFYAGVGFLSVIAAASLFKPGTSRLALPLVVCCVVGALAGFSLKSKPPRDWTAFVSCWKSEAATCTTVVQPAFRVTVRRDGSVVSVTYDPTALPPDW